MPDPDAFLPADHWSRRPQPVGSWVCFRHGPITPARAVLAEDGAGQPVAAYRVVADKTLGHSYVPARPSRCGRGHLYGRGRVHVGNIVCLRHGGHWSWRCGQPGCGDELVWPPRTGCY